MAMATNHKHASAWTGWIVFASIMLMLSGLISLVYGLAAIFSQGWYVYAAGQLYIVNLQVWGWIFLAIGALKIASGALLVGGNLFGRVMGTLLISLSVLVNLAFIGAAPVWSVLAITLDVIVLYAILAHGSDMRELQKHEPPQ